MSWILHTVLRDVDSLNRLTVSNLSALLHFASLTREIHQPHNCSALVEIHQCPSNYQALKSTSGILDLGLQYSPLQLT